MPHPWALVPCPLRGTTHGWLPHPQSWTLSLPGSQEQSEEEAETDLSPRLPAAHIIGKDFRDLNSPSSAHPQFESFCSVIAVLGFLPSHHLSCYNAHSSACFPPGAGKSRPGSPHHSALHLTPGCPQSPTHIHCRGSTITPLPLPDSGPAGVKSTPLPLSAPYPRPPQKSRAWIAPLRIGFLRADRPVSLQVLGPRDRGWAGRRRKKRPF